MQENKTEQKRAGAGAQEPDFIQQVREADQVLNLLESCQEMLALVQVRYGNLYPDVNEAMKRAQAAISKFKPEIAS